MLVQARLTEELPDGSRVPIIGEATFSATVTRPGGTQESLDRLYDDGTHGDTLAGDGIFSRLYLNTQEIGTYMIEVYGHKAEVPVEALAKVDVIPFPEMILQEPVGSQPFAGGPLQVRVQLKNSAGFPIESGGLIASLRSPSGLSSEIGLVEQAGLYSGSFVPAEEGTYQIQVMGKNAVYRGLSYEEALTSEFEVNFVRTLKMQADEWVPNSCFDARGKVPVHVAVFSPQAETIELNVSGMEALQAYPVLIRTKGGAEVFNVEVETPSGILSPGAYQFHLEPQSPSGSAFEQQPVPANFTFQVPSLYQRCGSIIRWSGLSGFAVLMAVLLVARKIRLDAMPTLVAGTLRYWPEDSSEFLTGSSMRSGPLFKQRNPGGQCCGLRHHNRKSWPTGPSVYSHRRKNRKRNTDRSQTFA